MKDWLSIRYIQGQFYLWEYRQRRKIWKQNHGLKYANHKQLIACNLLKFRANKENFSEKFVLRTNDNKNGYVVNFFISKIAIVY